MKAPRIPYVNWYPADFMHGVRGLNASEVGVYVMLLCRIYEEDGPVQAHDERLAAYCGMRVGPFRNAMARLVELDKLQLVEGRLTNRRAEEEIIRRSRTMNANSKAGFESAKKRQQKQRDTSTGVQRKVNHTDTDTDTDKKDGGGGSARAREAENQTSKTDRETFLEAIGADPVSGLIGPNGKRLGTQADMIEFERWIALGLTVTQITEEARSLAEGKRDGPPSSFRYFTTAMQRLAGAMAAPALSPITNGDPMPNGGIHERKKSANHPDRLNRIIAFATRDGESDQG